MLKLWKVLLIIVVLGLAVGIVAIAILPPATAEHEVSFTISALPEVITAEEGETVIVTVSTDADPTVMLQYKWYYANAGSAQFKKSASVTTCGFILSNSVRFSVFHRCNAINLLKLRIESAYR